MLCQKGYIKTILERLDIAECKPASTLMMSGNKLVKSLNCNIDNKDFLPYRELIGSLIYLAIATRPDIIYSVSHLSQFNDCYNRSHWIAAKRVLQFIKSMMDYLLGFKNV